MADKSIDKNRQYFETLLNDGMDEVAAYELVYNVSNEEAVLAIKEEHYNYLVQSGISEETAKKFVFQEDMDKSNKSI